MKLRHPGKVNNPISPIKKKPAWIRTKIIDTKNFFTTKEIINKKKLHTVCQEASCPNISECWSKKHATFMIMGDTCTRACAFCNVKTGKPGKLDLLEPFKIAQATKELKLKHVVITSVDRDGTKKGYDLDLTKKVSNLVNIPVIASGGVGNLEHLHQGIKIGKASAVLAASIFHFGEHTILEAKQYLDSKGIPVRI